MLTQVADGVWVRQSGWVWTNSIVVRGEGGLILVDPGIDGSELNQLADDLDRLGIPVIAGFSTHPHWDHLLWHPRFGDVPRYATAAGANATGEGREQAQAMAAESASGIPLELIGLVTPLPEDGGPVPGEIIEHQAHAVGHAAVLLADRGVLLAGDMLSDVLIPLLDARRPDQVGAYETALDRLGDAARHVDVLVPGHGAVAEGPEVAARVAADRAYIDALRRGEDPVDARLGPDAGWLSGPHQSNLEAGPRAVGAPEAPGVGRRPGDRYGYPMPVDFEQPTWEAAKYPGRHVAPVGAQAGARELAANVYELDPGAVGSPLHVHHANEELLLVLSGTPTLRSPEGTQLLSAGAVIAFPRGQAGAHSVVNRSDAPVRYLVASTTNSPDVVEYLDTGATLVVFAEQRLAYPHGSDAHETGVITEAMRAAADRDA